MAFPLTHLCVAWKIIEARGMEGQSAAQFILGSIAPDAIHYRAEFQGAAMSNIGPAKKITHLCPVSDERWGQVTDNDGWVECVKEFLRENPDNPFAEGYAVHVLTDIYNNKTLWDNFRTNHPEEAAKGYTSDYYKDLRNLDTRLFLEFHGISEILALLEKAIPEEIAGIIFASETHAIQQNLLHEHFQNAKSAPLVKIYRFLSWDDVLNFIQSAADFCMKSLK
ncbi:MAG: hypothetical protein FWB96_07320 [Defluviitaleaceae bacterium]|nr:hypothetical protein [Defluviitaleaceae bacterium]MCL2262446.1 hypothetical protein [Defluviitaleaceae bacterium]